MKIKCSYCGNEFDETLDNCPSCGGVNVNVKKTSESGPRTLEELKKWFYETNGLTSEKTHIYVGENCSEPAVFGMYKDEDTNDFIVYKNKQNGERAIRYQGKDEQYAVNELYQLIQRQAIRNGVALNGAKKPGNITNRNDVLKHMTKKVNKHNNPCGCGCSSFFIILLAVVILISSLYSCVDSSSHVANYSEETETETTKETITETTVETKSNSEKKDKSSDTLDTLFKLYVGAQIVADILDGAVEMFGNSSNDSNYSYDSYDFDVGGNDSWDSGDWNSDWGYNIDSNSFVYCI